MRKEKKPIGWDCAGNPIYEDTKGPVHWDPWLPRHFYLGPRPRLAGGQPDDDWAEAWFESGEEILDFFAPED